MLCVDVAINLPVKNIFKQFTYSVPPDLAYLDSGWRVVVPFGAQKAEGFVVRRAQEPPSGVKVREVEAVLGRRPWFDEEMLQTARWLSSYYMCSLAEAMRLFVPGKSSIKRSAVKDNEGRLLYYTYEERLKERTVLAYQLTTLGLAALQNWDKRLPAQMAALEILHTNGDWLTAIELTQYRVSSATLRTLAEKGWVETGRKRILRNSYAAQNAAADVLQLTEEQQRALDAINSSLQARDGQVFLLQGVTGSGKTEVYLRAARAALAEDKQVLVLVPEIALTAQLVQRFQSWFGVEVAVAHSKLSPGERADVWYKIHTRRANILIGVRSAVFAPFAALGLVVIDEEHESSYKQEERPNYHARDVALERCRHTGATLVLGSATPDLCTYQAALEGKYKHLMLTCRANGGNLPEVEIVDMRAELAAKNFSVLSRRLKQALVQTAAEGEQAIVLLNRRGFSTFVMCRDCGSSIICPHCAVALVYHSAGETMRCHYCGVTRPVPVSCPSCGSRRIKFFGTGTQKAEAEIMSLPDVQVLRMDQDTTGAKFAHADILRKFAAGERNVLLGTQMVAKGHDIPNVTLVGVLSADSALNLPDFRASERAFALLTQAAGRAGRGKKPGHVIFQAYDVENAVVRLAARQDYETFARQELVNRRQLFYPPFAQLLKITVLEKTEEQGRVLSQRLVNYIQEKMLTGKLQETFIFGPFPALIAKVRDLYRFNILIKAADMEQVKNIVLASEFKELPNVYFDVDPLTC